MNQGAQPGARPATPETASPTNSTSAAETAQGQRTSPPARAGSFGASPLDALENAGALIRPALLPLAAPPVLCAIALLFAQGRAINWLVAIFTLLASVFTLAGLNALSAGQQSATSAGAATDDDWSARRPAAEAPTQETQEQRGHELAEQAEQAMRRNAAIRLGVALLAVAALCALPVLLAGAAPALLALALAVVVFALYGVDLVRPRIAPLDELIAPACLGPGLVTLTILAQGQRMNMRDWLVAAALGGMAFAVIEGWRVAALNTTGASRSLAALIGARYVTMLTAVALLAGFALAVALAVPKTGWPGALLTLIALPTALIGLSGMAASQPAPARRYAARRLARAYLWYGLALAVGLVATVIAQSVTATLISAFGL